MAETNSDNRVSIWVPALITLAITILRLVGELQHWSPRLFGTGEAGGVGAIVGISWLPIIFGPYFAVKLANAGHGPSSNGKAIGLALASGVVLFLGIFLLFKSLGSALALVAFAVTLGAAFVARAGWTALGSTLLAYAFAARIPVLVVMFIAMKAQWTTHYSAIDPRLASAPFWTQYVEEAFLPQMFGWVGYTVVLGSIFGTVVGAVARRKPAVQAAAASN